MCWFVSFVRMPNGTAEGGVQLVKSLTTLASKKDDMQSLLQGVKFNMDKPAIWSAMANGQWGGQNPDMQ